jgi:hypothetical protein
MDLKNSCKIEGASGYLKRLKRLDEYENTVAHLFPILSKVYIDSWTLPNVDALALAYFLDCYPRKVIVLDIGTFIGMSAFYFAIQPTVLRVVSVDPNPLIADEIDDKTEVTGICADRGTLQNLKVLDVAETALGEFDAERRKIQLCTGVVGISKVGIKDDSIDGREKIEIPQAGLSERASLVAFVDGLHTKEGVRADLEAIFESDHHAVAILHDCRGPWGPFVQAGIVSFMETAERQYHFHLVERMGLGLGTPSLGIVYSDIDATEVGQTLMRFQNSPQFLKRAVLLELREPWQFLKGVVSFGVPTLYRKLWRILRSASS